MIFKRITAFLAASALCLTAVSCSFGSKDPEPEESSAVSESSAENTGVSGIGELITPAEGDEDYELGSYRISPSGIKLYYDDSEISPEVMLALEKYFTCFQDRDFETYKECLYPDYIERYGKYLEENFEYGLENSFELNCEGLRSYMKDEVAGELDSEDESITGDFTITRLHAEIPEITDGKTIEEVTESFFGYFTEAFGMDYYEEVKNNSDDIEYLAFYIIAEGEDGEEHLIISNYEIAFARVGDKYYTFG
ncbi:MAG: hypothetical protein IJ874_05935 [Ruminococcus sp.]|nr:hypothetical protein [Ruminococcus sp.]